MSFFRQRVSKPGNQRIMQSVMFALCVFLAGLTIPKAGAQPANDNSSPVARLLATNPILAEINKISPSTLPVLTTKLAELALNTQQGRTRAGLTPTREEQAEMAANPAFARANQTSPDETLLLLRSANELLGHQHGNASPDQPQRVALVVGNTHYQNWKWRELAGARADVELVSSALRKAGFTLVKGGPQFDLDNTTLARDLADLRAASHRGTTSLLYFAGHGAQSGGRNYLVPADGTETGNLFQIQENALDTLENHDGSIKIIVLDACRDEIVMRGFSRDPQGLLGISAGNMTAGTFVVYSTAPNSVAIDHLSGQVNSPFASAFVREIMKPGVDIRQVLDNVSLDVSQVTDHHQTPWISHSEATGSFYFLPPGTRGEALASLPIAPPRVPYIQNGLTDEQLMAAAMAAHFAQNYNAERPLLDQAVRRGIPGALYELGYQYDEAVGRPRDYNQAVIWYQKAADAGNAAAMVNLGLLYENGQGVAPNMQIALALFEKAAALGEEKGLINLGVAYEHELGMPVDLARAEAFYKKASALNSPIAMTNLGSLYWNEKQYKNGFYWTSEAVKRGYAPAISNLGGYYFNGKAVPPDMNAAAQLFQQAALKGNYRAMANLAIMYRDGYMQGGRNYRLALEWSQKSASGGDDYGKQILSSLTGSGAFLPNR